jgi:hypothetical protein
MPDSRPKLITDKVNLSGPYIAIQSTFDDGANLLWTCRADLSALRTCLLDQEVLSSNFTKRMVEYRNVMLQTKPDVSVLVECAFPRDIDVSGLKRNCLIAVRLGYFHAAVPHPMFHVATPEENQAWLKLRFVGDECHIRLCLFDVFCAISVQVLLASR